MPSHRAVFLKPPESVCPPRASRGPGRGIPVRILDSGEISWTSATGDAATGRFSPISFPCHTSETPQGGFAAICSASLLFCPVTRHRLPDSSSLFSNSCGLFCTRQKLNSLVFERFRTLCAKHPGWGDVHGAAPPILKPRVEHRSRSLLATSPDPKSSTTQCLRAAILFLFSLFLAGPASFPQTSVPRAHLGFDRNDYPGDAALPILRKSFSFTGYWLSPPPGEKANTWKGKRELLRSLGFGFLVLYRGRESRELKNEAAAKRIGFQDAKNAAAAAKSEGFASSAIIFLDIEEGGRLPANYHAYLAVWSEELTRVGYHPGVYCSGMPVSEGHW